jgi:hypothetical protein
MTGLEGLFKLRNDAQPSSINHLLPISHYFWAVKAIPESPHPGFCLNIRLVTSPPASAEF